MPRVETKILALQRINFVRLPTSPSKLIMTRSADMIVGISCRTFKKIQDGVEMSSVTVYTDYMPRRETRHMSIRQINLMFKYSVFAMKAMGECLTKLGVIDRTDAVLWKGEAEKFAEQIEKRRGARVFKDMAGEVGIKLSNRQVTLVDKIIIDNGGQV